MTCTSHVVMTGNLHSHDDYEQCMGRFTTFCENRDVTAVDFFVNDDLHIEMVMRGGNGLSVRQFYDDLETSDFEGMSLVTHWFTESSEENTL